MELIDRLFDIARRRYRKIVLPEGDNTHIVAAAVRLRREKIAEPILIGEPGAIVATAATIGLSLDGIALVDPRNDARLPNYGAACAAARDSMTPAMAARLLTRPLYFGGMMLRQGDADAMVAGVANPTRRVIEAGLMTVGLSPGIALPSSYFLIVVPDFLGRGPQSFVFADCAVNADPDASSSPTSPSPQRAARKLCSAKPRTSPCCRSRPKAARNMSASTRFARHSRSCASAIRALPLTANSKRMPR